VTTTERAHGGKVVRRGVHGVRRGLLIDQSRRPWRREKSIDRPESTQAVDPTAEVDERESMVRALSSLSPVRRACVVLRYDHDLTVAETARALGWSGARRAR
jgi:DNA-directed RNA polymerase specialized sigma24 family protein